MMLPSRVTRTCRFPRKLLVHETKTFSTARSNTIKDEKDKSIAQQYYNSLFSDFCKLQDYTFDSKPLLKNFTTTLSEIHLMKDKSAFLEALATFFTQNTRIFSNHFFWNVILSKVGPESLSILLDFRAQLLQEIQLVSKDPNPSSLPSLKALDESLKSILSIWYQIFFINPSIKHKQP